MDNAQLFRSLGLKLDAEQYTFGAPQQSGVMTVLPIFGPSAPAGRFAPPLSGLKLGGVKRGYGNIELNHSLPGGVAIVPLHMGYIQDGVQNHALCRSSFIGAGQKVVFDDACCVQQSQGGYLEGREQWFFILPLRLRETALNLRRQVAFGKLWPAIAELCARFGMSDHGHLEQVICRLRSTLTQFQSRFELLAGQTGALFFLRDRLVGVEIAPDADYFREVWMPLVCFAYGTAALELERKTPAAPYPPLPLKGTTLAELRQSLADSRWERQVRLRESVVRAGPQKHRLAEEERYLDLRLVTAVSQNFAGQIVYDGDQPVYVSLGARSAVLQGLN